jgi:tRNA A37 threonylcarbamoyladenosine synthetase subunit TsaC/SUA5/YrdC
VRRDHPAVGDPEGLGFVIVARYFDVHPSDPQPRLVTQVVAMLSDDALIAYPTDSCYALGFELDSRTGADRIR